MGAIVLFDGVCNFCNGAVNFLIARDKAGYFKFAPLQSGTGQEVSERFGIDQKATDSVILVENQRAYTYSSAALRIARKMDGAWRLLYVLIAIPKPVRDLVYRLFARYRYALFGRKEVCMMPTPEVRQRFLT
jgi:predicted DCC family thiol-disulfide oxidoreductase YuxK